MNKLFKLKVKILNQITDVENFPYPNGKCYFQGNGFKVA